MAAEKFLGRLYDLKYLVGDKWALAILVTLSDGPMRRVEILSTINSYSIGEEWSDKHAVLHDSMLARTLKKDDRRSSFGAHTSHRDFPPKSSIHDVGTLTGIDGLDDDDIEEDDD